MNSAASRDRSAERKLLAEYRELLAEASRDAADAQARMMRHELTVRGLEAALVDDAPPHEGESQGAAPGISPQTPETDGDFPPLKGEAAVAQVLREAGRQGLTLEALTRTLVHRGWGPDSEKPESATRAAANRLRRKDSNFVFVDQQFAYRPLPASPSLHDDQLVVPR